MRKLMLSLLFSVLVIFGVTANGSQETKGESGDSPKFTMNIEHNNSDKISWQKSFEFIQSEMKAKYPNMESRIYPNGQLAKGDWKVIFEQLQAGTIQITCESQGSWSTLVPELISLSTPFLFDDPEHMIRFMSDENRPKVVDEWFKKFEDNGLKYLGYWPRGSRQLLSTKGPIITPADIKGMKFRVMGLDMHIDIFKAFGAKPVPLPYSEVYTGLQLGTIQGEDNSLSTVYAFKQYEQAKYFNVWNYMADGVILVANKDWYDSLPAAVQKDLKEAIKKSVQVEYAQILVQEKDARDMMESEGVIFTDFTPEMKKPWKALMGGIYSQMEEMVGPENWKEILAVAEKTRK